MTIELSPELERMIAKEIQRGHFSNPDEVIKQALTAFHERKPERKSLVDFFRESPLVGVELNLERSTDPGRSIEL